jgi:hypothetical protein
MCTCTHARGMQQSILLQSSKIWPKTTKCGTSIHFWNQWHKSKTQIPNSIFATSDWVAEPLIFQVADSISGSTFCPTYMTDCVEKKSTNSMKSALHGVCTVVLMWNSTWQPVVFTMAPPSECRLSPISVPAVSPTDPKVCFLTASLLYCMFYKKTGCICPKLTEKSGFAVMISSLASTFC